MASMSFCLFEATDNDDDDDDGNDDDDSTTSELFISAFVPSKDGFLSIVVDAMTEVAVDACVPANVVVGVDDRTNAIS